MLYLVGGFLLIVVFVFIRQRRHSTSVVYIDKNKRSKVFVNKKYGVNAKPDLIIKENGEFIVEEYKDRNSRVYKSDILQAKASALAARAKYPITKVRVRNRQGIQHEESVLDEKELYREISGAINMVKRIRKGVTEVPCYQHPFKCNHCAMIEHCSVGKITVSSR
jgi:CRISPR/Cas system-associated exonuclease Cas4 (RecB family)